jgi:hypothetical protein
MTQDPFAFYVNLSEDVDPETFLAEMDAIAGFLSSVPDRVKLLGVTNRPFLDVKLDHLDEIDDDDSESGEHEVEEDFFPFKYRAKFELNVQEWSHRPQWYLSLSIDVRRQPKEDPANRVSIKSERLYHLDVSDGV